MTDVAAPFTTAQEAVLRASTALKSALGDPVPVYRILPVGKPTPYIVIGEDQILEDSTDCQDGSEIFATVHLWMKPSPVQAITPREVGGIIRSLLNADLNIAGHCTVEHGFEDTRVVSDPDGSTHVQLGFRYLTEVL